MPEVYGVDLVRQPLDLVADGLELVAQGLAPRLGLGRPVVRQLGEALPQDAAGVVLGAQPGHRVGERRHVAQQLAMASDQRIEIAGLPLEIEGEKPVAGVGRRRRVARGAGAVHRWDLGLGARLGDRVPGGVAPADRDQRGRARAAIATPEVGQWFVLVQDGRFDELAQLSGQPLGALGLGLDQRAALLGFADAGDECREPADARGTERGDDLEDRLEVGECSRLQHELVLELLVDQVQLPLGLADDGGRVAPGGQLVLGDLHQGAQLADLGPAEIEVQRAQRVLQFGDRDAQRIVCVDLDRRRDGGLRGTRHVRRRGVLVGGRHRGADGGRDGLLQVGLELADQLARGLDRTGRLELAEHGPTQDRLRGFERERLRRGGRRRQALAQQARDHAGRHLRLERLDERLVQSVGWHPPGLGSAVQRHQASSSQSTVRAVDSVCRALPAGRSPGRLAALDLRRPPRRPN